MGVDIDSATLEGPFIKWLPEQQYWQYSILGASGIRILAFSWWVKLTKRMWLGNQADIYSAYYDQSGSDVDTSLCQMVPPMFFQGCFMFFACNVNAWWSDCTLDTSLMTQCQLHVDDFKGIFLGWSLGADVSIYSGRDPRRGILRYIWVLGRTATVIICMYISYLTMMVFLGAFHFRDLHNRHVWLMECYESWTWSSGSFHWSVWPWRWAE